MTKRRWARYVRVSRQGDRHGEAFMSPGLQTDAIGRMIRATGGAEGPVFEDIDKTGRDFERVGVQSAIEWVLEDPGRRGLATYDASRLGRNTSESLDVVKSLRGAGAAYASACEKVDDTPEGMLALTIWLAMAEHASAKIGQTWRAVHESRAERGLFHGTPPLGYRVVDRRALVDSETAGVVREVFERYARGEPLKRVASRLSEARGHHVPTQNAKRTLSNRFYIGDVRFRGEWVPGAHEPVVSGELWGRVDFRLRAEAGQQARRAEPRSFLLGILKCDGCGGGVQVVNRGRERGSIACTQFRKRYPADRTCQGFGTPSIGELEDLCVVTMMRGDVFTLEQPGREPVGLDERVETLAAQTADLRRGRGRLAAAYARGSMTDEVFDDAMSDLQVELDKVEIAWADARAEQAVAPGSDTERATRVLDIMGALLLLPAGEARSLLREVVSEIRVRRTSEGRPFARWYGEMVPVWR